MGYTLVLDLVAGEIFACILLAESLYTFPKIPDLTNRDRQKPLPFPTYLPLPAALRLL